MTNFNTYVYIMSAGHSGSTLLDLLLGSHSQIISLGEISHLPKNIALNNFCSCGKTIKSCPFWNIVINQIIKATGINLFTHPYKFHLGLINPSIIKDKKHRCFFYRIQRKFCMSINFIGLYYNLHLLKMTFNNIASHPKNNFLLYDKVLEMTNSKVIIDSTKIYQKGIDLYNYAPSNVRIILLSRDGRGVMYSNLKRSLCSRRKALKGWLNYYKHAQMLIYKHIYPEHIHTITYENLVQYPIQSLTSICKFLNLDFEKSMLDFTSNQNHITNGNEMRFVRSSELKLDISWKNGLSKSDLEYFAKYGLYMNRALGHI